jgi:hypothetical protein
MSLCRLAKPSITYIVFPNKDGSELIFTLYQRPGMSDRDFRNDEEQIKADLEKLKALIEKEVS